MATILAINPGSTSSKISLYNGEQERFTTVLRHDKAELDALSDIAAQREFRMSKVIAALEEHGVELSEIDAFVGRGGIIRPLAGGVYKVCDDMVADLMGRYPPALTHPSGLGGLLARELGDKCGKPSYVVDPVVVDEMWDVARVSGYKGIERKSIFHALNQKAISLRAASDLGKPYEECRFVVAHMGGGVSVGAHLNGYVVDVNDAINGEGPMSPERSGGLPLCSVVDLCFGGELSEGEIRRLATKNGGLVSYLGTSNGIEVENMITAGDENAGLIFDAMAYQISKEIGAMLCVLEGEADAVILTGGLAYSKLLTDSIRKRVGKLADIMIYPGEDEMGALALGALRALTGECEVFNYSESAK